MNLRNMEGATRSADITRTPAGTRGGNTAQSAAPARDASSSTTPPSRGAFFDMMLSVQAPAPAPPAGPAATRSAVPNPTAGQNSPAVQNSTASLLSGDENSTGIRASSRTAPRNVQAVGNSPSTLPTLDTTTPEPTAPAPPSPGPPVPVSDNPVDVINALLTRLGYDASAFHTRVTSSQISYPGASYEYPLLEVTVNGERVGFHLPSAMRDPRITAANISSMLGRPLLNFGVFA